MAGTIKGIIVEISGDTSGLQKALSKVNSATSSLSKELRGINSLLKLDPKNTELLSQKQIVLNQEIGKTEEKLKTLKQTQEEADKTIEEGGEISQENYRNLQREITKTETELSQLKLEASDWTTQGKKIEEFGNELTNLSTKLSNLGNKLTASITLPISALTTLGITYNAEIEKYTTAFKTFLGSAEEAEKAINNIKEDASKTTFDVTNLVQANQMLISTGESAEDSRETILALGDAVTATGGGNDELTRMASNLQQIKNAGKATAMDIRQFAYAGIDVYGILADYMGKTTEEIKDMEISYEDLTGALKKANQKGGKYYNAMSNASETLTGQTNQLKAEIKEMLGELTKSLMPIAKKIVSTAKELIEKFDSLSDSEKENIVKIGLMVAAAGPLIKVLGTVTGIVGNVVGGIGKFSQAIGVLKTGAKSSSDTVNTLAKVIGALKSPAGIAITALTALAGTLTYFALQETEAQKEIKELAEEIGNAGQELDDYNKQIDETTNAELKNTEHVQKLKKELDELVDENGKVKDSDKNRANFIVNELNSALGTEIELTDGQIENYQNLSTEIDKLIEKKKAEIKLSAEEEKYENAIKNQEEAVENLKETLGKLGMSYSDAKAKAEEYRQKMQEGKLTTQDLNDVNIGLIASFIEADDQVKTHTDAIKQYETDYANFTEGKYDEIGKTIQTSTEEWTDNTLTQIQDSITEQSENLEIYKQIYEETGNEVASESQKQAENNINTLISQLSERTTTIGALSKDEIQAWATLASEDRTKFNEILNSIADSDVKKQLQTIGTAIDQNQNLTTDEMKILAEEMEKVFKSTDSSEWGEDLISGLASSIRTRADTELKEAAKHAASVVSSFLHFSKPDIGPLRQYEKWMPDMIKGLSQKLKDSSPLLVKETKQLAEKLSNNLQYEDTFNKINMKNLSNEISNNVIDRTKTVYTTPNITFNVQELDQAKLEQCFNYVNRKFGSQY